MNLTEQDYSADAPTANEAPRLIFGIYPGSVAGTSSGLAEGALDDPARIQAALAQLQGGNRPFIVRGYVHYTGLNCSPGINDKPNPVDVTQYAEGGRSLDLVLCFRDPGSDLTGWLDFIRAVVRRHGPQLAKLQITEEPNLCIGADALDGCFPNVRQALVSGVIAAKQEALLHDFNFQVGFSAALTFAAHDDFWSNIAVLGGRQFTDSLDYVGLDFFPDVFYPVAPESLSDTVAGVLKHFREVNMATASIPVGVPVHITENGWPTGPTRSYERQAAVIETVIRTVHEHRRQFNITHYEFFSLRDADSANPDLFYQFGLLRDDYTPKPAFETYRRLIAELGAEKMK